MPTTDHFTRERAALVWAKSLPMREQPTTHWLPLWQHLDDTGAVAGYLWDEWLAEPIRHLVAGDLPGGQDDGRRLLTWLAGIHDIGKCSPAFAIQTADLCDAMIRHGFPGPGTFVHHERSRLRHEIAGALALNDWLGVRGFIDAASLFGSDAAAGMVAVVGGHHGDFPDTDALGLDDRTDLYGEGPWQEVRTLLLDRAAQRFGVDERLDAWRATRLSSPAQIALAGVVIMADWIASAPEYFPLLPQGSVPALPGPADTDDARLAAGIRRLHLSPPWRPTADSDDVAARFRDRFPAAGGLPRPVQEAAFAAAQEMTAPGLMIVEAPMGEGKTEAAFLAAEPLAERTGATGCLIALPTQATSNAMFSRTLNWLERLPSASGTRASVALVHGKAALNDDYHDVRYPRRSAIYDGAEDLDERTTQRLVAAVDEWMTGRKRAALSSFVVGTIDQVLFAALRARHVMLRQLALMGKVVILDEVHAADVYMSQFLHRALEWLGACGTSVILLSATLPPGRRAELYDAYERGRTGRYPRRRDDQGSSTTIGRLLGYPSIVTTGPDGPVVRELSPSGRRTDVTLHPLRAAGQPDDDLDALAALLRDKLQDGGCAVVIRNTVARVQRTARHLADVFDDDEITVAHAGFLACDRIENDARLLGLFGPPGEGVSRPRRHVVVASQVVEQSLDVDFDLMVTDIAPVDLVLQRMGRLHRHRRGTRPAAVSAPECWITGVNGDATPAEVNNHAARIYGRYRLLAAAAVLEPYLSGRGLRLPEDIAPLVASAYDPDLAPPPGWETSWADARTKDQAAETRRESNAATHLFARPDTTLFNSKRGSAGSIDEDSPAGQACVRDGGESVEVVVVQQIGQGDFVPSWVAEQPGAQLPFRDQLVDHDIARALARCTLRLPFALVHEGIVDETIKDLERNQFRGWDKSPYISGSLALVLDQDGAAVVAGHRVRYDRRWGLVVEGKVK